MSVPVLEKFSRLALLDVKGLRNHTNTYIRKFSIVISSLRTKPRQLSGGNQQKLMLSICLGTEPACMIVNEPTRGIDVGAKAEIHDFIMKIANNGVGVIVFSSDLPELLSISDRIIVMHDKKIAGELTWPNLDESLVMTLAAVGGERGDCA
jgi:ABC-type sugar transport system ATPase subunit